MDTLFRGKRKDNGGWAYGYYIKYGYAGKEKDYIVPVYASALYAFEVIHETVGQWTGREIDDGEEEIKLFAGDILGWSVDYDDSFGYSKTSYDTGVIVWDDENCCYALKAEDGSLTDFEIDDSCVIIGNIHDNPAKGDAE